MFGNWDVHNLITGEYELVLHAICSTLGYAEPGIDESWSKPISGSIQLQDRHRVIKSSYPPNKGTAYMGEEISVTFELPVGCDKDDDEYWFDVKLMQGTRQVPKTYYSVFCEESTIYIKPVGKVCHGVLSDEMQSTLSHCYL